MNEGKNRPDESHRPTADAQPTSVVDDDAVYARFGQWLELQLEQLEARWIHLAAPNANRPRRLKRKPR